MSAMSDPIDLHLHPSLPTPPPITTTTTNGSDNTLSDIFHTSPSHSPGSPINNTTLNPHSANLHNEPSETTHLHTTHSTAGYRDAIAIAKESTLQAGFDEGYSLGAQLGSRAGWVLGVMEGLCAAVAALGVKGGKKGEGEGEGERMGRLLGEARRELSVQSLFGPEYWSGDGLWRFAVHPPRSLRKDTATLGVGEGGGGGGGGIMAREGMEKGEDMGEGEGSKDAEVTFEQVAEQHPLVVKWIRVVEAESQRWDVNLRRLEGEEWERGRVGAGAGDDREREGEPEGRGAGGG